MRLDNSEREQALRDQAQRGRGGGSDKKKNPLPTPSGLGLSELPWIILKLFQHLPHFYGDERSP